MKTLTLLIALFSLVGCTELTGHQIEYRDRPETNKKEEQEYKPIISGR